MGKWIKLKNITVLPKPISSAKIPPRQESEDYGNVDDTYPFEGLKYKKDLSGSRNSSQRGSIWFRSYKLRTSSV